MEDFQSDGTVPKDRDKLNRDERQLEMEDAISFSIWLGMTYGREAVLVFIDVVRLSNLLTSTQMEEKWGVDDTGLIQIVMRLISEWNCSCI